MKSSPKRKVAIVGARGYSGLELARLALRHPEMELAACFAHEAAFRLADYLPESAARGVPVLPLAELERVGNNIDTVFLATPAEASLELAPKLLGHGPNVIDLSGAFRFPGQAKAFESAYKLRHVNEPATYGLVPFARPATRAKPGAVLVANPGCYATAALMAIVPLLKAKAVKPGSLVIDAKSGTSGAGRKANEAQLFTEVDGECLPYRVGKHQHLPEIALHAELLAGAKIDPFFSTHLLPTRRGIIASVYAVLESGADVGKAFAQAYEGYPLARVTKLDGDGPQDLSPSLSLSLKKVVGTARTHLSWQTVGSKLYLFSLIDNLLKGAASQAVENFNALHDLPVALGLEALEGTL